MYQELLQTSQRSLLFTYNFVKVIKDIEIVKANIIVSFDKEDP